MNNIRRGSTRVKPTTVVNTRVEEFAAETVRRHQHAAKRTGTRVLELEVTSPKGLEPPKIQHTKSKVIDSLLPPKTAEPKRGFDYARSVNGGGKVEDGVSTAGPKVGRRDFGAGTAVGADPATVSVKLDGDAAAEVRKRMKEKTLELIALLDKENEELSKVLVEKGLESDSRKELSQEAACVDKHTVRDESRMNAMLSKIQKWKAKDLKLLSRKAGNDLTGNPRLGVLDPEAEAAAIMAKEKRKQERWEKIKHISVTMCQYLAVGINTAAPIAGLAFGPAELCFKGAALILQALVHVAEIPVQVQLIFEKCRQCLDEIKFIQQVDESNISQIADRMGLEVFNASLLFSYINTIFDVWRNLSRHCQSWIRKARVIVDESFGLGTTLDNQLTTLTNMQRMSQMDIIFRSSLVTKNSLDQLRKSVSSIDVKLDKLAIIVKTNNRVVDDTTADGIIQQLNLRVHDRHITGRSPALEYDVEAGSNEQQRGQWIYEGKELQQRLFCPTFAQYPSIISLYGKDGTGKTSGLLSLKAHLSAPPDDLKSWKCLSFFAEDLPKDSELIATCLKGICVQLITLIPQFGQTIRDEAKQSETLKAAATASERIRSLWSNIVIKELTKLYIESSDPQNFLVIIDCASLKPADLASFISENGIPPGFRFLFAYRSERPVLTNIEPKRSVSEMDVTNHTSESALKFIKSILQCFITPETVYEPNLDEVLAASQDRLIEVFRSCGRSFTELARYANNLKKSTSLSPQHLLENLHASAKELNKKAQLKAVSDLTNDELRELSLIISWLQVGFMPLRLQALALISDLTLHSTNSRWTVRVRDRIEKKYHFFVTINDDDILQWKSSFNPEFLIRTENRKVEKSPIFSDDNEELYLRVIHTLMPHVDEVQRRHFEALVKKQHVNNFTFNDNEDHLKLSIICLRIILDMENIVGQSRNHNFGVSYRSSRLSDQQSPVKDSIAEWASMITQFKDKRPGVLIQGQDEVSQAKSAIILRHDDEKTDITDVYDEDDIMYMTTYAIMSLVPHLLAIKNISECEPVLRTALGSLLPRLFKATADTRVEMGVCSPVCSSHYWYGTHWKAVSLHAEIWLYHPDLQHHLDQLAQDQYVKDSFVDQGFDIADVEPFDTESSIEDDHHELSGQINSTVAYFMPPEHEIHHTGPNFRFKEPDDGNENEILLHDAASGMLVDMRMPMDPLDRRGIEYDLIYRLFLDWSGAKRDLLVSTIWAFHFYEKQRNSSDISVLNLRGGFLDLDQVKDFIEWAEKQLRVYQRGAQQKSRFWMTAMAINDLFCQPRYTPSAPIPTLAYVPDDYEQNEKYDELGVPRSKFYDIERLPGFDESQQHLAYQNFTFKFLRQAGAIHGVNPYWLLKYIDSHHSGYLYLVESVVEDASLSARKRRDQRHHSEGKRSGPELRANYRVSPMPDTYNYGNELLCPPRVIADTLLYIIRQTVTASLLGYQPVTPESISEVRLWIRLAIHNHCGIHIIRTLCMLHNSEYSKDIRQEMWHSMAQVDDWRLSCQDFHQSLFHDLDMMKIFSHSLLDPASSKDIEKILLIMQEEIFSRNNIYNMGEKISFLLDWSTLMWTKLPSSDVLDICTRKVKAWYPMVHANEVSLSPMNLKWLLWSKLHIAYISSIKGVNERPLVKDIEEVLERARVLGDDDTAVDITRGFSFVMWNDAETRKSVQDWLIGILKWHVRRFALRSFEFFAQQDMTDILTAIGADVFAQYGWRQRVAYICNDPVRDDIQTLDEIGDRLSTHSQSYRDFFSDRVEPQTQLVPPEHIEDFPIMFPEDYLVQPNYQSRGADGDEWRYNEADVEKEFSEIGNASRDVASYVSPAGSQIFSSDTCLEENVKRGITDVEARILNRRPPFSDSEEAYARYLCYMKNMRRRCRVCFDDILKSVEGTIFVCRHCLLNDTILCESCHSQLYKSPSSQATEDTPGKKDEKCDDKYSLMRETYCYELNSWLKVDHIGQLKGTLPMLDGPLRKLRQLLETDTFIEMLDAGRFQCSVSDLDDIKDYESVPSEGGGDADVGSESSESDGVRSHDRKWSFDEARPGEERTSPLGSRSNSRASTPRVDEQPDGDEVPVITVQDMMSDQHQRHSHSKVHRSNHGPVRKRRVNMGIHDSELQLLYSQPLGQFHPGSNLDNYGNNVTEKSSFECEDKEGKAASTIQRASRGHFKGNSHVQKHPTPTSEVTGSITGLRLTSDPEPMVLDGVVILSPLNSPEPPQPIFVATQQNLQHPPHPPALTCQPPIILDHPQPPFADIMSPRTERNIHIGYLDADIAMTEPPISSNVSQGSTSSLVHVDGKENFTAVEVQHDIQFYFEPPSPPESLRVVTGERGEGSGGVGFFRTGV